MNKQEAIKEVKSLSIERNGISCDKGNIGGVGFKDDVNAWDVICILEKLDQPPKVVVPKFVAGWLETYQCTNTLLKVLNAAADGRVFPSAVNNWILDNQRDFVVAWLDGYQVEKEKLYTVEIPDPNRPDIATFLYKENGKVFIGTDIFLDEVPNYKWKNEPENQLTESEIKEDFEWAWQFREEVD